MISLLRHNKKNNLIVALFLAVLIATVFVFWHPHPKDDLFRYFAWLDILRSNDPMVVLKFILSRGELLITSYFWAIAKTGLYGLLQFFPTIISLFTIQYIAIDYIFRQNKPVHYAWLGIGFFLGCFEIFLIPSGVRSTLAFSLFCLALYREYYLSKPSLWLYLMTPLIHLGSVILLVVRLMLNAKNCRIYLGLLPLLFVLMVFPGGEFLKILAGDPPVGFLGTNLYKLGSYLTNDFPISMPYLYKIAKLLIMTVLAGYLAKKTGDRYIIFYLFLALVALMSIGNYVFWYRLLEVIIIGSPLMIIKLLELSKRQFWRNATLFLLLVTALVGLRVQIPYYTTEDFTIKTVMPKNNQGWEAN